MKSLIKITSCAAFVLAMAACSGNSAGNKDSVDSAKEANEQKDTPTVSAFTDTVSAKPVDKEVGDFAVEAANGGMTEVAASQLAQQKATDSRVKSFADMMVEEHTKVNNDLKSVAASKNITLPAGISNDAQKDIDDLAKKEGKDFDKAYMKMMVNDHEKTIKLLKKGLEMKDPDISTFSSRTMPAVQKHLNAAKAIDIK